MRILNYGSMNLDYVYTVASFVQPGQTACALTRSVYGGGKGLNQSIALARAGSRVYHAGTIGTDGESLLTRLRENGVDTQFVFHRPCLSAHTVIQVNNAGENCILFYRDPALSLTSEELEHIFVHFGSDDWLLTQNEMAHGPQVMQMAKARGMRIAWNPSPLDAQIDAYPMELVDLFLLNELEAQALSGCKKAGDCIHALHRRFPRAWVLITLGARGSMCLAPDGVLTHCPAAPAHAVDTTGAGDTYTGFFLSAWWQGAPLSAAMARASNAAAYCVQRHGASSSIPFVHQLDSDVRP